MTDRRLIAIVGTTAAGKTALAVELARRLERPIEVIGADSRQVYRHMDVGTGKPTLQERNLVRHHVIDVVDPDEPFSLRRWLDMAQAVLDDTWARRAQPLLVGGTGQYIWALLEGWRVPHVPPQPEFRRRMEGRDAAELLEDVRHADPTAAERIGPTNRRRLIRALEVKEATGRPISYWQAKQPPDFDVTVLGLRLPRDELYRRIDRRVDGMIGSGLVEETRRLLEKGYPRDLPSMSGIGYKEACAHLAGELSIEQATSRIKTETHRLARHQNAWFKRDDPRIHWLDAGDEGAAEAALRIIESGRGARKVGIRGR